MNGQAWSRYPRIINNPLAFTDPNGYCFVGKMKASCVRVTYWVGRSLRT
jgi:hypothetical protein